MASSSNTLFFYSGKSEARGFHLSVNVLFFIQISCERLRSRGWNLYCSDLWVHFYPIYASRTSEQIALPNTKIETTEDRRRSSGLPIWGFRFARARVLFSSTFRLWGKEGPVRLSVCLRSGGKEERWNKRKNMIACVFVCACVRVYACACVRACVRVNSAEQRDSRIAWVSCLLRPTVRWLRSKGSDDGDDVGPRIKTKKCTRSSAGGA